MAFTAADGARHGSGAASCARSSALLRLPFDLMRMQRAQAVQAGLLRNSMLASRDFERAVDVLERLTLGPCARRV